VWNSRKKVRNSMKRSASEIAARREDARARKRARLTPQANLRAVVKSEIARQGDKKYTQDSSAAASIDYSGTVYNLLTNLTKGDGTTNFNGSSIDPQSLQVRYAWNGTVTSFNVVRTIIFQWFDTTAPTPAAVLASVGNAQAPLSPLNIQNRPIMRILSDSLDAMNANLTTFPIVMPKKVFVPGKRMKRVMFQPVNAIVISGGLYLLAISDDAVTDFPDFQFFSELRYTD